MLTTRDARDLDSMLSTAYHAHLAVVVALIAGIDIDRIVTVIVQPAAAQIASHARLARLAQLYR